MESVRSFQNFEKLAEMQQYLANSPVEFATSELYSSAQDAKIVDLELRKSQFRAFEDKAIFDLVDAVVHSLSLSDPAYSYSLRRDDITETRYDMDGYFLKHKDFLSVTSNLVEEFTLILCVTPQELLAKTGATKGGETLIYPYASTKPTAFDTTTPGNGLLFRKDLEHAGARLKTGAKHILTANLLATRKQVSNQVLFVTFPRSGGEESMKEKKQASEERAGAARAQAVATLRRVANQDSSYALPVDCLTGTMLDAHVRFINASHEQQVGDDDAELPPVVTYQCTDFSFEEFGTVAKILRRSYVTEQDLKRHEAAIEFFGPFLDENLLVNLAVEEQEDREGPSCTRFVKPKANDESEDEEQWSSDESSKASPKKYKTDGDDEGSLGAGDLDVVVCENESRTKVVNECARQLGFNNYVPFKLVFVQGFFKSNYYSQHEQVPVGEVAGAPSCSLFHRDTKGRVTFTAQEAEAASDFIASMNFDERVKAGLQKKRFELPQKTVEINEYYCNDSTYGKVSVLCVTGVVRLDSSADVDAHHMKKCSKFDAWPAGGDIDGEDFHISSIF